VSQIKELFDLVVKKLEEAFNIWDTSRNLRGKAKDLAQADRDKIIEDVGKAVEHMGEIVSGIRSLRAKANNGDLDRLRENLRHHTPGTFEDVVNTSINQTIVRSLNTSLTTLFVAVAIMLFGGASVRPLAFVMSVGIIVGSYSSIFVASPVLLWASRRYLKPR
jgi:ABC-type bacteriocin/lantibiotic exporter with double-glycine peptidase domain